MQAASSVPLLRHDQVMEMEDETRVLESKLQNPRIEDKGAVREQLRRVQTQLESQRPRPYATGEMDAAVKREAQLRAEISVGMLSHEEMRKCPPGAIDRHMQWEKRNMPKIEEWKNIQRRLTAGTEDHESASVEMFRPTTSTMNMDGALIPGKQFFLPPHGAGLPVTFSDEQLAALRVLNPSLADMLATLTNEQRGDVKAALEPAQAKKPKRTLSAAHKEAMKAGRAAKKAA